MRKPISDQPECLREGDPSVKKGVWEILASRTETKIDLAQCIKAFGLAVALVIAAANGTDVLKVLKSAFDTSTSSSSGSGQRRVVR